MPSLASQIVTAQSLKIQSLHHYQPFDMDRVFPIIAFNRLYFSKPYDFNDPWDCRPAFDVEGLFDPATREQTAIYLEEIRGEASENVGTYGKRLREDLEFIQGEVRKFNGLADKINEWHRIYALALQPDVTLMWSHYARGHTGICLEFDATTDFIAPALQVQYCKEYPTMQIDAKDVEQLLPVLTKAHEWHYEVEYRLFALDDKAPLNAPQMLRAKDHHWVTMPPGTLKSVIIGCQMPEREREKVRALVARAPVRVELRKAVKVHDRYAVRIEPMSG